MVFNLIGTACFGGIFSSLNGLIPYLGPFMREHEKRLYNPILFFLISTTYQIPSSALVCLFYQLSFFWAINIQQGSVVFWKYYSLFLLTYITSAGFADILSIGIRKIDKTVQTFSFSAVPLFMLSGFIAKIKGMWNVLVILSYLSFFKFSFQGAILIEFDEARAKKFQSICKMRPNGCPNDECVVHIPNNPDCNPYSVYDFYEKTFQKNMLFLLILALVFRIVSSLVFYHYIHDKKIQYKKLPPMYTFRNVSLCYQRKLTLILGVKQCLW